MLAPGTSYKAGNTTDYVVLNDNQRLGYWDATNSADALFQIYAVEDVPEADQIVTYTYNYTLNGVSKKASPQSMMGVIGHPYHELDVTLPDYVEAEKPSGRIKAEDNGQSIEIVCTEALPFQTSTDNAPAYYYLGTADAQSPAIFYNKSEGFPNAVGFRALNSDIAVNDIPNSLWYVTGNPFDGFQFHNVGANAIACSSAVISSTFNACFLAFDGAAYKTSNWDVRKTSVNSENAFTVYPHGEKDHCWRYSTSDVRFNYGSKYPNEFATYPATFTFPMYNGGDDNVYNTFAAPFDVALADDNVKMYKGSVNTAIHELTLSQVDAAPAKAGVMLLGENSSANEVTLKAVSGVAALEGNSLEGITSELSDLTGKLILGISDQTGAVGFFTADSSVASLQANHAYLPWADSQVKGISMRIEGEATSIGKIEGGQTNASGHGAIYDLMGRRVLRTEKGGFYIQNGRKFIVK